MFPNPAALLRLAGAVLVEQHHEWESEASMPELRTMNTPAYAIQEVTTLTELTVA